MPFPGVLPTLHAAAFVVTGTHTYADESANEPHERCHRGGNKHNRAIIAADVRVRRQRHQQETRIGGERVSCRSSHF
jgi:hypothetical protein